MQLMKCARQKHISTSYRYYYYWFLLENIWFFNIFCMLKNKNIFSYWKGYNFMVLIIDRTYIFFIFLRKYYFESIICHLKKVSSRKVCRYLHTLYTSHTRLCPYIWLLLKQYAGKWFICIKKAFPRSLKMYFGLRKALVFD
jgi:hypothetical protein